MDSTSATTILPAEVESTPVAIAPSAGPPPQRWKILVPRILGWAVIAILVWTAGVEGLHLRRWVFEISDAIRFNDDDARGLMWGLIASGPEGFLNQYDKMQPEVPEWQDQLWVPWLDYSPLRLLVMRQWAAWVRVHHPPEPGTPLMDVWQRPYPFNEPVMLFNTTLEAFSAVCAFFLTRLWVLRGSRGEKYSHFHGTWQGIVAAMVIWFSPDIIISAHAWFQWDTWAIPWYLCACLLASLDWWFAAGLAVAIGVNLKGQMMSVAPIFIIWPLVQGRFGGSLRWICGMAFGMAMIASPWLISYLLPDLLQKARDVQTYTAASEYPFDLFVIPRILDVPATIWIAEMLIVSAAVPWLLKVLLPTQTSPSESRLKAILHSRRTWVAVAAILLMATAYWPWLLKVNRAGWYFGLLASAALAAAVLFFKWKNQPYVWAAIVAGGLFSCVGLFHGTTGWWECSFHYGSIHWPYMVTGPASNLPAVFELRFGWPHRNDEIAFTLPAIAGHWPSFMIKGFDWPAAPVDVTSKMLFNTAYAVMLVLSGIAIGLQARRNDRRMLVALATPWILFFLIPTQIQERNLVYGAGAAACCIGDSVGMALLGVLLASFSAIMHIIRLLDWRSSDLDAFGQNLSDAFPHIFSPQSGHTMLQYLQAMHPDMAWGVLVIGMVFFYLSFVPSRRRKRDI